MAIDEYWNIHGLFVICQTAEIWQFGNLGNRSDEQFTAGHLK